MQKVRESRRGLDLGRIVCHLGHGRRHLALACHYCDAARTDGFSVVLVDLTASSLAPAPPAHFDEGTLGEMAFAGGRLVLIGDAYAQFRCAIFLLHIPSRSS